MKVENVERPCLCAQKVPFYPTGDVFINRMPGPGRPVPRTAYIKFAAHAFKGEAPTALRMNCKGPVYPIRPKKVQKSCTEFSVNHYEAQTPCKHFPDSGTYLAEAMVKGKWTTVALNVKVAQ